MKRTTRTNTKSHKPFGASLIKLATEAKAATPVESCCKNPLTCPDHRPELNRISEHVPFENALQDFIKFGEAFRKTPKMRHLTAAIETLRSTGADLAARSALLQTGQSFKYAKNFQHGEATTAMAEMIGTFSEPQDSLANKVIHFGQLVALFDSLESFRTEIEALRKFSEAGYALLGAQTKSDEQASPETQA